MAQEREQEPGMNKKMRQEALVFVEILSVRYKRRKYRRRQSVDKQES
jgi:hypothetical protein